MGLMCDAGADTTLRQRQKLTFALALNVFALGAMLRSLYIFRYHPATTYVYSDMQAYVDMAYKMLSPETVYSAGDAFHPPGTSMFLALSLMIDGTYRFAMSAQFAMSALVPLLIGAIGYELFGRRAALLALVISSLYFQFIDYAAYFLSENPFLFFMLLSMWLLIRSLRVRQAALVPVFSLFSGLAMGVAATFKSVGLAAAGLVGLFLLALALRQGCRRVVVLLPLSLIGILLIVVPVSIRATRINEHQLCVVSGNGPMNVLLGHYGDISSLKFDDTQKRGCYYEFGTGALVQQIGHTAKEVKCGPCDGRILLGYAWEWTKENPGQALALSFDHVFNLFRTVPWPGSNTPYRLAVRLCEEFYKLLVLVPVIVFVAWNWRGMFGLEQRHHGDMLVFLPILALLIVAFMTIGEPRYRIPFDGFLILLAARCYVGCDGATQGLLSVQPASEAETLPTSEADALPASG